MISTRIHERETPVSSIKYFLSRHRHFNCVWRWFMTFLANLPFIEYILFSWCTMIALLHYILKTENDTSYYDLVCVCVLVSITNCKYLVLTILYVICGVHYFLQNRMFLALTLTWNRKVLNTTWTSNKQKLIMRLNRVVVLRVQWAFCFELSILVTKLFHSFFSTP